MSLPHATFDARISMDDVIERVPQIGVSAGRRCCLDALGPVVLVAASLTLPIDWGSQCARVAMHVVVNGCCRSTRELVDCVDARSASLY
jgi:hypothetical protein